MRSVVGKLFLLAPMVIASCSFGGPDGAVEVLTEDTLPLAETAMDDPDETTVASVLAPSQITGSTAPAPATPPPCSADDVELWTAAVRPGATTVDAVIRIRNVSDDWCEPDIGRSPRVDPAIEPDVWLLPGDTADLVIGQEIVPCDEPALVSSVQVAIGATSLVVPSAVVTCGWWLTAFYPNGAVTESCDGADLEMAATATAVVVRISSFVPCVLAAPSAVDGEAIAAPSTDQGSIAIFSGDVVAVGRVGDDTCTGVSSRTIQFGAGEAVDVAEVPCGIVFDAPLRAWYGAADGPTAALAADVRLADVFDALDPFGPPVVS